MNRYISFFVFSFLILVLTAELANLIDFGTQEYYLNHPGFPEGDDYLEAINKGRKNLIFWTIITFVVLFFLFLSYFKKKYKLHKRLIILTFSFALYLPVLAFINKKLILGTLLSLLFISIIFLSIFKIQKST